MDNELNNWLKKLEALHPNKIDLGLERIRSVADTLGLLKTSAKIITIAGTNGKGSTVAALQALLLFDIRDGTCQVSAKGEPSNSVGSFTSPHLFRFNERIAVNGEYASDRMICEAFEAIEEARQSITLTYFEFSALAALWVFRQEKVDYIILEVGLGGRLDAVNMLDADIAIITSIALDHQAWLGDTVDLISLEKGGILREGQKIIFGQQDMPTPLVNLANEKVAKGASLFLYQPEDIKRAQQTHGWVTAPNGLKWFGTNSGDTSFDDTSFDDTSFDDIDCDGIGFFDNNDTSEENHNAITIDMSLWKINVADIPLSLSAWSCALQVASDCGVVPSAEDLQTLMIDTSLLGRRSHHSFKGRVLVCDVAHNPAAVENLVDYFQQSGVKQIPVIFAALDDKALEEMGRILKPIARFIAVPALEGSERVLPPNEIADRLLNTLSTAVRGTGKTSNADTTDEELLIKPFATMEAAINWAIQETDSGDKILVLGSFLTVASCIEHIGNV